MRLYLQGKSKLGIGYTPDWLMVDYFENGECISVCFDISGCIDYTPTEFNCRVKGMLEPWTLFNHEAGEDIDLYGMKKDEVDKILPDEKIEEIICNGIEFLVGIYPSPNTPDDKLAIVDKDVISKCEGRVEMTINGHSYEREFTFDTECYM